MTPEEEFAALKAENAAQRQQLDALLEQNAALIERVRDDDTARLGKDAWNGRLPHAQRPARLQATSRARSAAQPVRGCSAQ